MNDDDELTPATISSIIFDVRNDTADPLDARRLLEYYCSLVAQGSPIPTELASYVADCFGQFLNGKRYSLNRAFGIDRRAGRPHVDEFERIAIATEVLRSRLKGVTHEVAVATAGAKLGKGVSVVGLAWREHKFHAEIQLKVERILASKPWAAKEQSRVDKILKRHQKSARRKQSPPKK